VPTLKERIDADIKEAMRAKDELRSNVVRMLKSAVKYKEVEPGASALDDAGIMGVIATLIKQRRDSVEQYKAGNRPELAEKEEKEIAVLQGYLPAQLSAAELTAAVAEERRRHPDKGVFVKADRRIHYGAAREVMESIHRAGVEDVQLGTEEQKPASGSAEGAR